MRQLDNFVLVDDKEEGIDSELELEVEIKDDDIELELEREEDDAENIGDNDDSMLEEDSEIDKKDDDETLV